MKPIPAKCMQDEIIAACQDVCPRSEFEEIAEAVQSDHFSLASYQQKQEINPHYNSEESEMIYRPREMPVFHPQQYCYDQPQSSNQRRSPRSQSAPPRRAYPSRLCIGIMPELNPHTFLGVQPNQRNQPNMKPMRDNPQAAEADCNCNDRGAGNSPMQRPADDTYCKRVQQQQKQQLPQQRQPEQRERYDCYLSKEGSMDKFEPGLNSTMIATGSGPQRIFCVEPNQQQPAELQLMQKPSQHQPQQSQQRLLQQPSPIQQQQKQQQTSKQQKQPSQIQQQQEQPLQQQTSKQQQQTQQQQQNAMPVGSTGTTYEQTQIELCAARCLAQQQQQNSMPFGSTGGPYKTTQSEPYAACCMPQQQQQQNSIPVGPTGGPYEPTSSELCAARCVPQGSPQTTYQGQYSSLHKEPTFQLPAQHDVYQCSYEESNYMQLPNATRQPPQQQQQLQQQQQQQQQVTFRSAHKRSSSLDSRCDNYPTNTSQNYSCPQSLNMQQSTAPYQASTGAGAAPGSCSHKTDGTCPRCVNYSGGSPNTCCMQRPNGQAAPGPGCCGNSGCPKVTKANFANRTLPFVDNTTPEERYIQRTNTLFFETLVLDQSCPGFMQETLDGRKNFNDYAFEIAFGDQIPDQPYPVDPISLVQAVQLRIDYERKEIAKRCPIITPDEDDGMASTESEITVEKARSSKTKRKSKEYYIDSPSKGKSEKGRKDQLVKSIDQHFMFKNKTEVNEGIQAFLKAETQFKDNPPTLNFMTNIHSHESNFFGLPIKMKVFNATTRPT